MGGWVTDKNIAKGVEDGEYTMGDVPLWGFSTAA